MINRLKGGKIWRMNRAHGIMQGMDWDNLRRIKTYRELISFINETGFLPLFKNEIERFSAEEHVSPLYWWTGDQKQDPWVWRELIADTGEVRLHFPCICSK